MRDVYIEGTTICCLSLTSLYNNLNRIEVLVLCVSVLLFSYLISKLLFVHFLKQPIVDGRLGPSPKDKVLYVSSFNCQESNSKGQGITHVM